MATGIESWPTNPLTVIGRSRNVKINLEYGIPDEDDEWQFDYDDEGKGKLYHHRKMMISISTIMIRLYFIWLSYLLFTLNRLTVKKVEEDTLSLDLDNLWDNYEWEEIQDVKDVYYEVEQITTNRGVRGSEVKYEILKYLYYRKSMKPKKLKKDLTMT